MKTRLRTPSTDQSSRRPPHRKKCTRIANCFIGRHPGTGTTFIRSPCVFSNHAKEPGWRTIGIVAPITSSALDVHPSTPPFGVVPRTRKLDCHGMKPARGERLNPAFTLQRHTAPTAGVMVWGAIVYNARSPIVLIRNTMAAQLYVHDILQPNVSLLINSSQEPFFNKTMLGLTRQECYKIVSTLLV
ncbi:uncharacterized protein TNCV_1197651 [Trichonephila clavipes]|uniref:Uncharacterized protein n=1 Tax=Trichonephila clavipes TaxID=2585209 RepID=A0A8X6S082_TRICX|nr:uncharacterized protein TNCV_1197651 [Trichonephila clavipes]